MYWHFQFMFTFNFQVWIFSVIKILYIIGRNTKKK